MDDWLPTTEKQRRPDGTSLAYARCARQQLWVSFIEKAYAKAHGAYRFISGGEAACFCKKRSTKQLVQRHKNQPAPSFQGDYPTLLDLVLQLLVARSGWSKRLP